MFLHQYYYIQRCPGNHLSSGHECADSASQIGLVDLLWDILLILSDHISDEIPEFEFVGVTSVVVDCVRAPDR